MVTLRRAVAFATLLALSSAQQNPTLEQIAPAKGPFNEIPMLGFGTWDLTGPDTAEAVASAIEAGYRMIDGAKAYNNQKAVGEGIQEGIKRANITREDLWITSKIWSNFHGSKIEEGMQVNLDELGLDYLDLALMHFPIGNTNGSAAYDYVDTWRNMEKLVSAKTARFIGISNFNVAQVNDLLRSATIKPKVHQLESHPYLQQTEFINAHKEANITITAYAPLGDTHPIYSQMAALTRNKPTPLLQNAALADIGKARNCTAAQVALAWNLRRGVAVHPKAANLDHQKENFEAYKCALTPDDDAKIVALEEEGQVMRYWNICRTALRLPCYTGLEAA